MAEPTFSTSTHAIALAVQQQFADRPTLHAVTAQLLADNLTEKYPLPTQAVTHLRLAIPRDGGGRALVPLLEVALNFLAERSLPDLSPRAGIDAYLSDANGNRLLYQVNGQRDYDLSIIIAVIRELPQVLFIAFQEALAAYWGQAGDAGISRWQWLGDLLRTTLRASALRRSDLLPEQRRMLDAVLDHPELEARSQHASGDNFIHAYTLETTLSLAGRRVTVQASDILLVNARKVLLCAATGTIEAFTSLEAFGQAWGQRFAQRYRADQITWNRFEPAGNIFDVQAALLLMQQLDDLAAMGNAGAMARNTLESRYQAITDLVPQVGAAPTLPAHLLLPLTNALPDWLKRASASQRFFYFQHLVQLAGVKQRTRGRHFLDGLKDLRTFAADALSAQIQTHPDATGYRANDLELSIAVAVGDLGSGYIEPVTMSLTELAVKNLSGKPRGRLSVRHTAGLPVPAWMDQAYIERLVTDVDIGGRYPQWLNEQLLGDTPQAHQRQALFEEQMRVQLPVLALMLWARAQSGFTRQGYRYVAALMGLTQAGRTVDEQEVVIRPLALLRQPGATPDTVTDMYLIEPRDTGVGPHILYRGQYAQTLHEFPTRAALLHAIATPGDLQDSILTWLPNGARAIYDHGGFQEPHLTRFIGVGSEFAPLTKPQPALLAEDEASGELLAALENRQLMSYLFGSYARALVQIAEQTSTSNAESRWAVVLEGSWLIFNTLLLPLLRGPAMLAGWMLQMAPGLLSDIPNLNSTEPAVKETAWVDLLVNLGLLALHVGLPATPLPTHSARPRPVALEPLLRTLPAPAGESVAVTAGIVGLPSEPPGLGRLLIDFRASSARSAATDQLFEHMLAIRVPWPDVIPDPLAIGPFQGLYRIDGKWHAAVRGRLFPVNIVPGFGEVYAVSAEHPKIQGIKLKSDGRGHWSIDEGLRLAGGGPKVRIAELRKRKQERIAQLKPAYEQFVAGQRQIQAQVDAADNAMIAAHNDTARSLADRTRSREGFRSALAQQTAGYVTALDGVRELAALEAAAPPPIRVNNLLQNIIQNTRKEIDIADYARIDINRTHRDLIENAERRAEVFRREGQPAVDRYFEFLRQTAQVNETMIGAYEIIDSRLLELAQSPGGDPTHRALTQNRPNEMTALRLKGYQLVILRMLCNPDMLPELSDALDAAIDPIVLLARSHADLREEAVYSHEERVAVLDNLVQQYGRTADGLQSIEAFNEALLDRSRLTQLLQTVQAMEGDAQQQLVQELKQAPSPVPAIPRRTGSKRVIKTPSGMLVGRARPRIANQGGDIVDVIAPFDDQPLASYHEHAPDVWVKIDSSPAPAPPRMSYTLAILKNRGKKLLEQMQANIRRIEGYVPKASTPKEIHEQLQREARKFEVLAQDLDSSFTRSGVAKSHKDTQLIRDLHAGAETLTRKGIELRIHMALSRLPVSEDVEFLLQTGDLQAQRKTQRTQLKTGLKDFLQEYVLVNRQGLALWFAHFHYPGKDTPKAQYTVAHFKTREQRFDTYASLLAKETDPTKVIAIHRALITTELAQNTFLPLSA